MKILVFGNLLVKEDNLALKMLPRLREKYPEIEFKEFDPTENLEAEIEDKTLNILDVAEGINEIVIIDNLDKLELIKSCSMHDFDLAYNLKLLKKIEKLKDVKIVCVPFNMGKKKAIDKVIEIIQKNF